MARTVVAMVAVVSLVGFGILAGLQAVGQEGLRQRPGGSLGPRHLTGNGKIAFSSDRAGTQDIWVINPDGTGLLNLTSSPDDEYFPAWSPDGSKVAFSRGDADTGFDLWVMNADGADAHRLTSSPGTESQPAWSPDGTKIAYVGQPGETAQIWVMDSAGTNQHALVTEPGGGIEPAWSPDGSEILFYSGQQGTIAVIRPDGTGFRSITGASSPAPHPHWSPNGMKIAFQDEGRTISGSPYSTELDDIWVINADGTDLTRLTNSSDNGASSGNPVWSPDGTSIAFVRFAPGSRDGDLYLMNPDGTGMRQLTSGPADDLLPSWQPVAA
jgi:Tol biopolymer transport system component